MYADDTAVFYFADNVDELRLSLQYDMQTIAYWMRENRLSLNVSKTKLMLVGSKPRLQRYGEFSVSLNGETVEKVDTFKYLGMIIDPQLHFHQHVDYVVDKTTARLGLLYKTRWLFNQQTALMLYKSIISPHFDYGSVIYEVAPNYQLSRLQIIQNAAARLILMEEYDCPVYAMHERLRLDTLATRRSKAMVKLTYCCLHNQQPLYLLDQLKQVTHHGLPTRSADANVLVVPRTNSRYGQMAYGFRGPVQWNVTNVELKAAVNFVQLKNLLLNSWYRVGIG